jgi:hypothetical protein
MASTRREYSINHHLFEHMKFSGIERDNLNDLITIVVSLKNKYGIVPLAATGQGYPVPNALMVSYALESIALNKIINVLMGIPRHSSITITPLGIPKSSQIDVDITLGS